MQTFFFLQKFKKGKWDMIYINKEHTEGVLRFNSLTIYLLQIFNFDFEYIYILQFHDKLI